MGQRGVCGLGGGCVVCIDRARRRAARLSFSVSLSLSFSFLSLPLSLSFFLSLTLCYTLRRCPSILHGISAMHYFFLSRIFFFLSISLF